MQTDKSKIHFVLVAGFSSDHKEAYGLKACLLKLGYSAYAISFYGASYMDDFTDLTAEQCQQNIADYINACSQKYEQVYGIGISLGGALLLDYAKTHQNLRGIVSIGTPFKVQNRKWIDVGLIFFPLYYPLWRQAQKIKKWRLSPIGATKIVMDFIEKTFPQNLGDIATPTLFLHSKKDGVSDWTALEESVAKMTNAKTEIEFFSNGRHVIDHDPDLVTKMSLDFLRKI